MKELLQIERTVIDAGLKREYKFFQISDAHISYTDEKSSEIDINDHERSKKGWDRMKVDFAKQFSEHYDSRYDVEAHALFEALLEHSVDFGADAVIFSGDIMDRVTDSNIRYLKKLIKKHPQRVVYCPGNHAHHDEYGAHRNMYDRFKGLIDNPEFDVVELDDLKIITIDNGTKKITQNQLNRLKEELSKNKKILLVLHAPIKLGEFGEVMGNKLGNYFLLGTAEDGENAIELVRLIEENDNRLIAVLAGHIHGSVGYPVTQGLMQYTTSSALIGKGREIIIK